MRRITAVLPVFLLFFLAAAGWGFAEVRSFGFAPGNLEDVPGAAMKLRFDIENRYHVSILLGEECTSVPINGFELQIIPRSSSVFHWVYHGEDQYTEVLQKLDKALSAYPQDFLKGLRSAIGDTARLQFLIGDRIVRDGRTYGGMTASDTAGHSTVFLAANATDIEASVHHALWYTMEARILFRAPMSLKDWKNLNPQGFSYAEEESILPEEETDPEDWFVNEEARENEKEDRAAVFEAYMTRDSAWWETRPHLQAKLKFLMQRVQGVFKEKGAFRSP